MSHPVRHWPCFLLLAVLLAGCSTTSGPRFGGKPGSRSIAVVGERPMPATSGEPGGQVAADVPDPVTRPNPKARISGRVVDDQGQPVPGVTVRLADGRAKGGKDIRATTDRAGGFTLNGLRAGSTYELIAEAEDDRGPLTGRAEARTADTGVEIALAGPDEVNPPRNRPGRASRARPISSRESSDPAGDEDGSAAVNPEDLPPAAEAEAEPEPESRSRPARPRLSAPVPSVGWKKGPATDPDHSPAADNEAIASSSTEEAPTRSRPSSRDRSGPQDDDINPLPPAIDRPRDDAPGEDPTPPRTSRSKSRGDVSSRTRPGAVESAGEDSSPAMPARRIGDREVVAEPPPMPPVASEPKPSSRSIEMAREAAGSKLEPGPEALAGLMEGPMARPVADPPAASSVASTEPPGSRASPPARAPGSQAAPTRNPATEPVLASTTATQDLGQATPPGDDYNPFLLASAPPPPPAAPKPPGPTDAPPPSPPGPEPESTSTPPRKKWGDLASADAPRPAAEAAKPAPSLVKRLRGGPEGRDATVSLCSYDTRLRRIVDFRLPDLEGKPVRFQDLDSDYVLLDFWGTWCPPCLESIPHLIALQKQYGPRRLRIVGIACEQDPPELRQARVAEATRKLGINYAVLLSGMDGKPCPVQQSLQVQAYPTAILVNRQGRILWRSAGATPATQDRLDRVLAALSRDDSTVRR